MTGLRATEESWTYRHDNVAVSEVRLAGPEPVLVAFNQALHGVQGPGEVIF